MKPSTTIIRAAGFGLLALAILIGSEITNLADKPAAAAEPSQLAREMTGTWIHVGTPNDVREAPAKGGRLKFRTGRHWTLTSSDPATGLVVENFGGSYTLKGDEYVETQDYADARWLKDNGKSFKFTVKVEGDLMTQSGIDNPYTEAWKRVR